MIRSLAMCVLAISAFCVLAMIATPANAQPGDRPAINVVNLSFTDLTPDAQKRLQTAGVTSVQVQVTSQSAAPVVPNVMTVPVLPGVMAIPAPYAITPLAVCPQGTCPPAVQSNSNSSQNYSYNMSVNQQSSNQVNSNAKATRGGGCFSRSVNSVNSNSSNSVNATSGGCDGGTGLRARGLFLGAFSRR